MKSTKTYTMYICLLCLFAGCTGMRSNKCINNYATKEVVEKDKINKSTVWDVDSSNIQGLKRDPLVCTLLGPELVERKEAIQKEIFSQIKKIEEIKTGYILSFKYDEHFLIKMADYAIAENNCCPFFTFEIKFHSRNDARLKITGPPDAKKMLGMFLPEGK